MKKIGMTVMLVFLGLLSVCSNTSAQDLSMLGSRARLESYARERVSGVQVIMSTFAGLGNGSWHDSAVTTPDHIEEAIASLSLHLEVANPLDRIYRVAYARGEDGYLYFRSETGFYLVKDNSPVGYAIPKDVLNIKLELGAYIPISFPGVVAADILVLDRAGQTERTQYVSVSDDILFFPTAYVGSKAMIRVTTKSPSVAEAPTMFKESYWSLETGEQVDTLPINGRFDGSIKNSLVYKELSGDVIYLTATNGVGIKPLIVCHASKSQKIEFSVYVNDTVIIVDPGHPPGIPPLHKSTWFKGVMVREVVNGSEFKFIPAGDHVGMMAVSFEVEAGSYHIIPVFEEGVIDEPEIDLQPIPYPVGEKG